jgi:hypothetical protein
MATTTTFDEIRDNWITRLEAATPDTLSWLPFRNAPADHELQTLLPTSAMFRAFRFRRGDPGDEPETQDPSAFVRVETVTLTIAYPIVEALYGRADLDDVECVMRDDVKRVREVLMSSGAFIPGMSLGWPDPQTPDRGRPEIWFQEFLISTTYLEAQTLT